MIKGQVQKSIKVITTYGVREDIQVRVECIKCENGSLLVSIIDILEPITTDPIQITQKQARCLIGILKTMESDGII